MSDIFSTENAKEALSKHLNSLDDYIKSDNKLSNNEDVLRAKINSIDYNRLININEGVRKIHYVSYGKEQKIPMRLLTIRENRILLQQTYVWNKENPQFIGGEDNSEFQRQLLIKKLSLATSPAPELIEDKHRYFTEEQLENSVDFVLAGLAQQYDQLVKQYNPYLSQQFQDEMNFVLLALFDGEPMNEKKLTLLGSLSSLQLSLTIVKLCKTIMSLKDNAQFFSLLSESNLNEKEENHKNPDKS